MTYQCEECGKSLATEGGFEIHMETHRRPAPRPETATMAVPAPVPVPAQVTPMFGGGKATDTSLVFLGLAVTTAVMFLVGMVAAVHPSLIRNAKVSTLAASKAHGVPIPDTSSQNASSTDATAPAVTTPPATTPAAAQPTVPDHQKVQSLVLQLPDYGPGWKIDASGNNSSGSAGDAAAGQEIDACLGGLDSGAGGTADTNGPDVANGALSASTSGSLYATAKDAVADFGIVSNPSFLPCLKSAFTKAFEAEGVPASAVSVNVDRFPTSVARVNTAGIRLSVTVSGPGGTVSFAVDMVGLQAGRAESFAMFASETGRFPASVEQALMNRMAAKLLNVEQVSA